MKVLMLVCLGLLSAFVTFAANWLALVPWRRAKNRHWTESARAFFPVRVAASSNLWVLPAALTIAAGLQWGDQAPHWAFMVFVSAIGAVAGTIPMDHEVFARIALKDLLRQVAVGWAIRFLLWFVFLVAIALMPNEFNASSVIIAVVVLGLLILWTRDGWIYVGRKLGLFLPSPERLQLIVQGTSARMNVSVGEVCLMRSSLAQAFAMPASRRLLFTERLLELLSDQEIAAVCTHELAHLTEARSDYYKRYVSWFIFLPWIFFNPMVHTFGLLGFVVLILVTLLAPLLYRRLSQKLELRADLIAHSNEPEPGAYAEALVRLHQDNLVPAVLAKKRATHPDLYDRLLAAGVTPDFARPAPAHYMAWHGHLFAGALGLLAMIVILRLTQYL